LDIEITGRLKNNAVKSFICWSSRAPTPGKEDACLVENVYDWCKSVPLEDADEAPKVPLYNSDCKYNVHVCVISAEEANELRWDSETCEPSPEEASHSAVKRLLKVNVENPCRQAMSASCCDRGSKDEIRVTGAASASEAVLGFHCAPKWGPVPGGGVVVVVVVVVAVLGSGSNWVDLRRMMMITIVIGLVSSATGLGVRQIGVPVTLQAVTKELLEVLDEDKAQQLDEYLAQHDGSVVLRLVQVAWLG
jgi:hypothetical protein